MSPGHDDRVAEAMRAIDRRRFLRPSQVARADYDRPLDIGHGMTNFAAENSGGHAALAGRPARRPHPRHRSGSGWTTALLAHLTGATGSVLGLEIIPELVTWGAANLASVDMPWARIEAARAGTLGAPECAPAEGWDRILVSAMASELPPSLVGQLGPRGILVIPVDGRMCRVTRRPGQDDLVELSGHYRFVPLRADG